MRMFPTRWTLAAALALCLAGAAGGALSQPGPYVEIRTYADAAGNVVGVQLISRGCADPQPPGWGVWTGAYTVDRGRCFVVAPPGGGEPN